MKVLLVARSLTRGGAATGAANLALALRAAGADVVTVAGDAGGTSPIRTIERGLERVLFDAETHCLRLGTPTLDLPALVREHSPDIVQLCDISANTIDHTALAQLPVPSVHRMSDFWPYHGPQHYAEAPGHGGLSGWLFGRAGHGSLHPTARVAPSHWLAERLTGPAPDVIRNAVALPDPLKPRKLQYSPLSFGFISAKLNDPRKGLLQLKASLQALPRSRPFELVTFGAGSPPDLGVPMRNLGPFSPGESTRAMAEIDILLCPSRQDNSPNIVTEALARGLPVIGQSGGGMESYLADDRGALVDFWSETAVDLGPVVDRVCQDYAKLSVAARGFAETELAPEIIGRAYMGLYGRLLTS